MLRQHGTGHTLYLFRKLCLLAMLLALFTSALPAKADPYPPYWGGGTGPAVHFLPVVWPADASWTSYTSQSADIDDPRISDPSNGGTSPQNYVNVSSSCIDKTLPSVYYQFDAASNTAFFRWRVEQIANTYATGPSAGAYASTDPWNSAQWTVLIDTNGDGYRDFAVHLDGSTGSPAAPIDRLVGIYGTTLSQSIDYINDPNIHQLAHNPTAFIDQATSHLLNFRNSLNPTPNWLNGSSETVWDYGTTRSTQVIKSSSCDEYFIDYQIPLGLLDASAVGGPKVTANTPISLFFATANSLNNPLQKDAVLNGDTAFLADPSKQIPFGDTITFAGGTIPQPIVQSISAIGCGPATLSAQVSDALLVNAGKAATSVTAVDFYSYFDRNANGQADDGQSWTFAAAGTTTNNPIGKWTASWNSSSLLQGQYLIGVKATDAQGNITWSYLTQAQINAQIGATPPNYANPSSPGLVYSTFLNTCGAPLPSITKTANPSQVVAGAQTQFTVTVNNPTSSPITVSQIQDALPAGFVYVSTDGGTLGSPATSPSGGATGSIAWTFAPAVSVAANSTRTLIFTASAPTVAGTYANVVTGATSEGTLTSEPVQIGVGSPRLTVSKLASVASANPGDPIIYTITYANDSPINMTGTTISDVLPTGLTFVSAANGGTYTSATRTVTWNVGNIAAGDGPFSVSFSATVDNPYPSAASIPLVNTATIDSNEASPASASTSTFINAPRPALAIQKDANLTQVAAGGQATFTISYANTGNVAATGVTITDPIPTGFTFVSATNSGTNASGTVTWNIGTVAAGATGSVQVTLQAANPYTAANPATNTATVSATNASSTSESYTIGVTQTSQICTTYYFRSQTTNVGAGADGGTQRIANSSAPTSGAAANVTLNATTSPQEAVRFYQDPATTNDVAFAGPITTDFYITKSSGPQLKIDAYIYDYDPTTGSKTLIGQTASPFVSTGSGTNQLYTFSVPASGTLRKNHRLLWKFDAYSNNNTTFDFLFDGTSSPSHANYCVTPPANLLIDKQINNLSVQPGGTLQYTIKFANIGQTNATGAQVVDTLPSGVTFSSATLNGAAVAPAAISGQQYTFIVRSSDTATAGQVTGGQSGSLVINATIDQPMTAGITSLLNSATLQSNETSAVTDTATAAVLRPDVTVTKSADKTLLIPGDTVTYAISVLNSGTATATNVTVADTLPGTAYFNYVGGSTKLNGTAVAPDPVTGNALNLNIGSLAAGASATVTFQMQVASSGAPAGLTTLSNTASVSDAQTGGSRTSDPVVVTISTNPNLRLVKTTSPTLGPVQAGGAIVYTLTLSNIGSSDAADVLVQDPIPTDSHYIAGTLVYNGTPQTDIVDGDVAHFDAVGNRAVYQVGVLPSGSSRTLQFTVHVDSPLTAGTTTINNVATVSASNTATKQGSATIDATAAPNLELTKSGPSMRPYPLTTLTSSASATTNISVANAAYLAVGDIISVNGTTTTITAISGAQLTLSTPVTGAVGAQVIPTYEYLLSYANTGNADATNVVVQDTLPVGVTFISADNAGSFSLGTVTWNVGTVTAGQTGTLRVRVRPNGAGSYVNSATIDSSETAPTSSNNVTTSVGGLTLTKSTTTAVVSNGASGTQASYVIALHNQLATAATGVQVTDLLPAGFTYASTTTIGGNANRTSTQNPTVGDARPVWGTWSIPANGDLTITFIASIAPTVGAATYQNGVTATSSNTSVLPFDELGTTAEDVTVFFGAVAGTVFNDANGDGAQNAGEVGISGVSVALYAPGPDGIIGTADDVLIATTTTGVDGSYGFTGVAAGNYQVKETDPAGYTSTTNNTVSVIVTTSGAPVVDFGDQQTGTVSGSVFSDLNGDGVLNGSETGLGGVTIELLDSNGNVVATTTTAGNGAYVFTGVTAGSYTVRETDPSGYISTTTNTVPVSIGAGGAASANFGDQQQGSVSGTVFSDLNGDGLLDGSETGLGGVTVDLLDNNGNVVATTTTAGDGSYVFTGVTAGTYTVRETDPNGYTSTTPNTVPVNVAAGGAASANFGDQQQGSISGTVFSDLNGDGAQGMGESGLSGITIDLLDSNGNVVATTTTAGDGSYVFTGVTAGTYTVRETDPSGYISTSANTVPVNLAAGGAASANFGDQQQGTISGSVFSDLNGDGAQGMGESGLGGVTVELLDSNGNVVATTTTAGNGSYVFTGVTAGVYTVREIDPSGYTSTTTNNVSITLGAGGSGTANFGDQQQGTVSGSVFSDLNGDGAQGMGESGLGGVTVELLDSNGNVVATTTTAGNGSYVFTGVTAGVYTVRETDPSGYTSTTTNNVSITLGAGGSGTANFGDQQQGTVSGSVFSDLNGDGAQGMGEGGLGGITIELLDSNGNVVATTTTAGNGSYVFTGVTAGVYTVRETDPSGYTSTTTNNVSITLGAGGAASANFGDQQQGSISGTVFSDLNGDGAENVGEGGLGGVTVELVDGNGNVVATTTTAGNGAYLFTGVTAGNYTVRETDPSGYASTTANTVPVSVLAGGAASANFGDKPVGTVGGTVFSDLDGDGTQDTGEGGLGGITIELVDANGNVVATTTTLVDGSYSFTGVTAGSYTVRETDPSGYTSTTPNTVPANVAAGGAASANFGDQQQGTVSGSVFKDLNGNGTQDTGESGLGGVTVELLDSNGNVVATTTTAGDGSYIFSGVTAGNYTVRETDPTGYVSTTPNTVPVTIGVGGAGSASFGDQQQGSVSGTVFGDLNANGVQDSGENGIGGVTVQLLNGSGTVIASTTTAGDGSYQFSKVPAGTYTVREIDPAGMTSTTPNDVPVAITGNGAASANFGDRQVGTVQGLIFLDTNGNGVHDPGENGIAGVQIIITDSQGFSQTVTTDASGHYSLTVLVGSATFSVVTSSLPPNLALTTNNQQQSFLVGNGTTVITGNVGYHIVPTAVSLVSFTAIWQNGVVVVRWETAAEMNTWGFYLYRSADGTRANAIRVTPSVILGKGHNQGGGSYTWSDSDVTPGQRYTYWLQEVELNGATNEYGPTASRSTASVEHQLFLPLVTD